MEYTWRNKDQLQTGKNISFGRIMVHGEPAMIMQIFREASKGHGKYCPTKNELRVRRGRKLYRFTCGEHELRFAAPKREVFVMPFASDVTPLEFKRCIASLIESQ